MSSNHFSFAAASASAFVCHNPHCTSRHTSFASEKAFTMHCQRSPIRFNFIRDAVRGIGSITTSQAIDVLEQNATLVINPVITSLKRASVIHTIRLMVDCLEHKTLMCYLHNIKMQNHCCPSFPQLNARMIQQVMSSRLNVFRNC